MSHNLFLFFYCNFFTVYFIYFHRNAFYYLYYYLYIIVDVSPLPKCCGQTILLFKTLSLHDVFDFTYYFFLIIASCMQYTEAVCQYYIPNIICLSEFQTSYSPCLLYKKEWMHTWMHLCMNACISASMYIFCLSISRSAAEVKLSLPAIEGWGVDQWC